MTIAAAGAERPLTGYRALPSVPSLVQLLASAVFARTASRMISVLLVLFVLDVYHSPALSGVVVLANLVPGMLASPIAGALLDRRGRVALIATDYFVGGATFTLLALLSMFGALPRVSLIVIVAIAGLTQPLSNSGTRSIIPVMVPRHLWDHANAIDSTGYVIANVCGPAIAGGAVALLGARTALLLPAGFLAIAGALLIGLHVPELTPNLEHGLFADALAGLRYVWSNLVLRVAGITLSLYFAASGGVLIVALPLIMERRLHHGAVAVGLGFAAAGATGFVAGLLAGRLGTSGREQAIFAAAGLFTTAALIVLTLTHSELVVLLMMGVVGATNGPLSVAMFSLRQRVTDPVWFGRTFAISMTINGFGNPIGAAIAGLIATHSLVIALGFGALLALVSVIIPVFMRGLRDAAEVSHTAPLVAIE